MPPARKREARKANPLERQFHPWHDRTHSCYCRKLRELSALIKRRLDGGEILRNWRLLSGCGRDMQYRTGSIDDAGKM